ncbi:aminopeptidase [Chloroflexota bacterium]
MLELIDTAKLIVETCSGVKKGEKVLIITTDKAFPVELGRIVCDVATSLGASATMAVAKMGRDYGTTGEPPDAICAAIKTVNAIICVGVRIGHTQANTDAATAGIRLLTWAGDESLMTSGMTVADLKEIKERSEMVAGKLTDAHHARVTCANGTDLTMSLEGRPGTPLHPMGFRAHGPHYAEAPIAPVEGTTEGTVVTHVEPGRWRWGLDKPLKCIVKAGIIVEVSGSDEVDTMRERISTDAGANVIAELGIGTCHTVPRELQSTRSPGGGTLGTAHIGIGRNTDLGGVNPSAIHFDLLLNHPTIELDGKILMRDGKLL